MPKYKNLAVQQEAEKAKQRARDYIARPIGPAEERLALAKQLSDLNLIGYGRQVLEKADVANASPELKARVLRRLAVLTAKDQELPLDTRLKKAESILTTLLPSTHETQVKQDIYGSLGGVFKQRFYAYALVDDLRRSLEYYEAGYQLEANDTFWAYVAINTAFMRDLLNLNSQGSTESTAKNDKESPEAIRARVIATLAGKSAASPDAEGYWKLCTLAEAYLGIGDTESAMACTAKAAEAKHHPWETETAVRQLVQLARIQARKRGGDISHLEQSPEWLAVKPLLGKAAVGAESFLRGKVGLALSGGGFRASLYHIGVLAKLAEFDMLRNVEVISSVSGGSIVAAYYYLKLKQLLESTPDEEITQDHYVKLVREMELDFLAGIQKNLRTRMLIGSRSNLQVLTSRRSSTTQRLANLYESILYRPLVPKQDNSLTMDELLVAPSGESENFYPQYDNWGRQAKVPILILNSTTLNSCHNWQFTAKYMGEPPVRAVDAEIDANDRFRRMYYDDAPEEYKKFPMSYAVAASACVPGLFDPLLLDKLYEDPTTGDSYDVKLVDGGVFDNQGVASLLDQDCSVLLVSDACGQTGLEDDPDTTRFSTMSRSNNILMARVREAQYLLLASLRDAHLLRGLMYVHLKKDLNAKPIDWLGCNDPTPNPEDSLLTKYGVRRDVQEALADIRTDLDSFSDVEADALMYSGYRMTEHEFRACISGFGNGAPPESGWRFLGIEPIARATRESLDLDKLRKALKVGHEVWGKAFQLMLGAYWKYWLGTVAVVVLGIVGYTDWNWHRLFSPVRLIVILALAALAVKLFEKVLAKVRYRNSVLQMVGSFLLVAVGWVLLTLHLRIIDPIYLRYGPKYRKSDSEMPPSQRAASASS